MEKIAPYYKAVAGALMAFLSSLIVGLQDNGLTTSEWLTALIALLLAGGAVFAIPNIPDTSSKTPEG